MVVEDDDRVRRLLTRVLSGSRYDVIETASANEALEICKSRPGTIDLLITDVNMPEMAGDELARRVTETHPGIRTVFVSGGTDEVISSHGYLCPGEGFVQKPFTADELLDKVNRAIVL